MEHALKESTHGTTLTLGGELTLVHANELKATLTASLRSGGSVAVRLEEVTDMDLSCLQLLYSARRTAAGSGQHFTLDAENSELFRRTAAEAGFFGEDHPPAVKKSER